MFVRNAKKIGILPTAFPNMQMKNEKWGQIIRGKTEFEIPFSFNIPSNLVKKSSGYRNLRYSDILKVEEHEDITLNSLFSLLTWIRRQTAD